MSKTNTESAEASAPREPAELTAALAASPAAAAQWDDLTPLARRDFITWIGKAKQEATRLKRVAVCIDKLERGERRPCCYNVVPLDLHNALKAAPAAKARWHGLSSDERRDWVDWVDAAEDKAQRTARVAQACSDLAAGQPAPQG
jgi:uncharacterized protein YdeI (YjbR/CyaY-like superfamily)